MAIFNHMMNMKSYIVTLSEQSNNKKYANCTQECTLIYPRIATKSRKI